MGNGAKLGSWRDGGAMTSEHSISVDDLLKNDGLTKEALLGCQKMKEALARESSEQRISDLERALRIIQSRCNPNGCVTSEIWHIVRHALSPAKE